MSNGDTMVEIDNLENLEQNPPMLEKIILAYWYSIPYDNDITPEKVRVRKDNGTFFNVDLIKNNKVYGMSCIQKNEINKYLIKLNSLKEHELDIIKRTDNEVQSQQE